MIPHQGSICVLCLVASTAGTSCMATPTRPGLTGTSVELREGVEMFSFLSSLGIYAWMCWQELACMRLLLLSSLLPSSSIPSFPSSPTPHALSPFSSFSSRHSHKMRTARSPLSKDVRSKDISFYTVKKYSKSFALDDTGNTQTMEPLRYLDFLLSISTWKLYYPPDYLPNSL
jgi:hypothetical protein